MFKWKNKSLDHVSTGKLLRNSGAYGLLVLTLLAMVFFGTCDPTGNGPGGPNLSGAAAKIDGTEVSGMTFRRAFSQMRDQLQSQKGADFNEAQEKISQRVLEQLVDENVNYSFARSIGMLASDDEIIKYINDIEWLRNDKGVFDPERFQNFLRNNRYSELELRDELRRSLTSGKVRTFISKSTYISKNSAVLENLLAETKQVIDFVEVDGEKLKLEVSEDEITKYVASKDNEKALNDYYNSNKNLYSQAEKVNARHILLSFKGARNASGDAANRSKEDAKKRAEEVLTTVSKPGADFAELAKKWTDEPSGKTSGGSLGEFRYEDMVEEFSKAAFALKNPGDLSAIVESPFGFHVIQLVGKVAAKNITFDQAKNEIAKGLLEKSKRPTLAAALVKQIEESAADQTKLEALLKDKGLMWTSTEEFPLGARFIKGLGSQEEIFDAVFALKKPGEVYPKMVSTQGKFYLLKLNRRSLPKKEQINAETLDQMQQSLSFRGGFMIYSALEKSHRENLEKKKRIWTNPQYLELDNQRSAEAQGT